VRVLVAALITTATLLVPSAVALARVFSAWGGLAALAGVTAGVLVARSATSLVTLTRSVIYMTGSVVR